jgi:trehalose 6-phosphate phosphatase
MSDTLLDPASDALAGRDAAWALFLDFDGTLVDISERPEAVIVDPALGSTLARLRDRLGGALAIVTGRRVETIDEFLVPYRFDVAGLHGAEHRLDGRFQPCRAEDHPELRRAVAALHARFEHHPDVLIEDKGCSVAVHWRLAPQFAEFASAAVQDMARALGADYRLQFGKAVAEVVPARATKGAVIEDFLTRAPYLGRRPVFIGDDLTDEHAFEAVNARSGISVRVGLGQTRARHRVETPAALRHCLTTWADRGSFAFDEV